MNKKLIAVAVAGALALPLAAQAQTANVTMYGRINNAFESVDIGGLGRNNALSTWSSRWGVRGIESLGTGLNAVFEFEAGITTDNNGGVALDTSGATPAIRNQAFNVRTAWVGLNGGFGTVKVGAGLTPFDEIGRAHV